MYLRGNAQMIPLRCARRQNDEHKLFNELVGHDTRRYRDER